MKNNDIRGAAVGRRMAIFSATTILAISLGAGAARAEAIYDTCMARAETNTDFSNCGGAFVARLEARMTTVWKRVYPSLSGEGKADLLAEQRAWIAYKDAACLYFADLPQFGAETRSIGLPRCKARILKERIRALEIVEDPRGLKGSP